ncbi:hypothetical protein [Flavivirga spongiicola]|uniref:Helix-turn-helix domain-containing protein n=1 Tax=Flavivirga spongiicola TaxID=421621 RepID=A0ABU7XT82_9FLAO|nr:hypothetical protein [Flavivirga sp. MEBiC05379]MDO5978995.1 hypothetical protein [Flavivirga sp. MEBiC05379]
MIGFVLLHREIMDWEWYQSPETTRVFIHLILRANYLNKKWQGIEIKRGQLVTSNKHLSTELSLSIQQIRTALKKLESSGYITRHTTNKFTLITLIGYSDRQSSNAVINNQNKTLITNRKHTSNNESTTTKKSNNKKKLNNETIEQRKENFKKQVFEHSNYSNNILSSFFNYWSELNSKKGKMRCEKDDFFDIKLRLEKWQSNEKPTTFNNQKNNTTSNR